MSEQGIKLLKMIFGFVSDKEKIVKPTKPVRCCIRCKSKTYRLDKHHIIYTPAKVVLLCRNCHIKVTNANSMAAIILNRKSTNTDRIKIWKWFLKFNDVITEDKVAKVFGINYTFSIADCIRYSSMRRIRR